MKFDLLESSVPPSAPLQRVGAAANLENQFSVCKRLSATKRISKSSAARLEESKCRDRLQFAKRF
jgi:hypothetical protein